MLFSFYYTEKIALFMRKKDPIYETINDSMEEAKTDFVNATISDNQIIPGINGLSVNVEKSFQKMKSFGAFNKYYLIFDQIKPEISLEDNKDKIITQGNSYKKSVSLILESQGEISNYFKINQIPVALLTTAATFERDSYFEQINNDSQKFKDTETLLNSIKQNKNICIITNYNESLCRKFGKYLVKPTLELNSYNIANVKSKIESGSIILVSKNAKLKDVQLLVNQINYKGLKIVNLSELIREENSLK